MAINYFENLGFGGFGERQQQAAMGAQNMRANEQAMRMNESNMQRQVKADEQAMLKFKDDQQKQRAAQGAGAFYQRLNAGDTQGALQVASQYQDDINNLGDPSFTVDSVAELIKTPQGVEQLKQMSLGMVQMAAGPEQFARFTAQQARPALEKQTKAQQVLELQREYQNVLKTQGPEAAKQFAVGAGLEKAPATSVSLNMPQDKKIAELDAKAFTSYNDQAKSARKQINTIGVLKTLSDKALSGTGADFLLKGGKLLNQLGVEVEGLTESEVFQQLSNTLVLDKSQQMSGALSNADMMFLQNTAPQLNNTKEGRRLSLEIAERLAKREIEIQNKAVEFRREAKKNGLEFDDAEFQSFMQQWAEQNPLMEGLKTPTAQAPKAAIDYLMANPDTKDAFIEKYGYLPEGVN